VTFQELGGISVSGALITFKTQAYRHDMLRAAHGGKIYLRTDLTVMTYCIYLALCRAAKLLPFSYHKL